MADKKSASMEAVVCPCGSALPSGRTIEARDDGGIETFTYLVCDDCGLERLSPRPDAGAIGAYYRAGYVPHTTIRPDTPADRLKRLIYEVFWSPDAETRTGVLGYRGLLRLVLRPVKFRTILAFRPPPVRRVFEFGAARPVDLMAFRAAGWAVDGCEPSA